MMLTELLVEARPLHVTPRRDRLEPDRVEWSGKARVRLPERRGVVPENRWGVGICTLVL